MEDKTELMKQISEAIQEVAREKEVLQIRSISRHNPDKVAEILYLSSSTNRGKEYWRVCKLGPSVGTRA